MSTVLNRRQFLQSTAATATAFSIVPRHVLGGPDHIAPSDKITFAYIGCGTEGLTEMVDMLALPEIQIVAVCDPNRESTDYVEWGKDSVRQTIAEGLGKPEWRQGTTGVPGGRDVAKEVVELAYARQILFRKISRVCRLFRFSGAVGEGERFRRRESHDSGPSPRRRIDCSHEKRETHPDAQTIGQPPEGSTPGD